MRLMKRSLLVLTALALTASAHAADTFKIDPSRSTIAFKVRHMLGTASGKFARFNGTIQVNREHPEQSSVSVSIDPASIDTGIAKRDEHLRSGLFEVARFPEITFKSRRVKQTGENSGEIVGDLTMHGVTREIVLKVEDVSKTGTRFRVTTPPLKRSQFGLVFSKSAETVSMIADEIAVELEIEGRR